MANVRDYINHTPVRNLQFKSAHRENYHNVPDDYALHNVYYGLFDLLMRNVELSDDVYIALSLRIEHDKINQEYKGQIEGIPIQETVLHIMTDDDQIKYNGYPKKLTWKQRINALFKGEI